MKEFFTSFAKKTDTFTVLASNYHDERTLKSKTVLLFLGSTIPCANYCKIPEQATVRWTHQSYRGAVYVGRDEEKWDQLQDEGRTREFAIVAEGRGGRMEKLLHSRAEWEIWKGSVGKTGRNWIRVWFWNIDLEDNNSNSFYLFDYNIITWAQGQISINFTKIFKVTQN